MTSRWWLEQARLHVHNPTEEYPDNVLILGSMNKVTSGKVAEGNKGPKLDIIRFELTTRQGETHLYAMAIKTFDAKASSVFVRNFWRSVPDDKKTAKSLAGTRNS